MVYYKLVKATIDAVGLAEIIINAVMRYHDPHKSIVSDQGLLVTPQL